MSRVWSTLDIGRRAMMNSQTGIQTVAHNIANRTTEGYSRQVVDFQANEPTGKGNLRIGNGAKAGTVGRVNNEFIEKQLERENNNLGYSEARASMMGRVEQVYNEQINKGLNQYMGEMFNAFREFSNNPESSATRSMVKESADFLAKDFQRMNRQLDDVNNDVDFRLATKIEEVNQITKEIVQLNEKIAQTEMVGVRSNDERDRRDLLVKNLGRIMNIKYTENKSGQLTITAGQNALLVSGMSRLELFSDSSKAGGPNTQGQMEIFYKGSENGTPINITKQLTGGEMGALLDVRDNVVGNLRNDMDELAYVLANEVNQAHVEGYDRYGQKGVLFFNTPMALEGASRNLSVSKSILEDVGRIAGAADPNSPGDNRVANLISSLEYKAVMRDGTATVNDFYGTIVGEVGTQTSRANGSHTAQKDITEQLKNIRESISGVSLDEETTKMIEFQKNFDASARLIRTADEMMDTVLNIRR